jgi:predicted PurR-regulated permease PerM
MAGVLLILLAVLILYLIRSLLAPFFLALILAYLLHPLVTRLTERLRLSRGLCVLIVYVSLLIVVLSTTTGLGVAISQRVSQLALYIGELSELLPAQIESIATFKRDVGPWHVDLSRINLEPVLSDLASAISPILSQTGNLLASIARATASAVYMVILVMVLGYYLLLDFGDLEPSILDMVPVPYRGDFQWLMDETGRVWNAFLRGQAILAVVMFVVVALVLTGLGVRFPLALGLIAGLMEFIPVFGPLYFIIQQIESTVIFPRIIGQSLDLHPLAVLLSVLTGGMVAGLIGLLLAAPTVATLRLWLGYAYRKTVGLETWPTPVVSPIPKPKRALAIQRLLRRWSARRNRPEKGETETEGEA